jgi:hypothetical protein
VTCRLSPGFYLEARDGTLHVVLWSEPTPAAQDRVAELFADLAADAGYDVVLYEGLPPWEGSG